MIVFDINVLVYAFREDAAHHARALQVLTDALAGDEPVGILAESLTAVVRLCTNHRVFSPPSPPERVLTFCDEVRAARAAVGIGVRPDTWPRFARLCTGLGLRGNDVPDAWLAALAGSNGARLVSFDRALRRFPGVEVSILGDGA